MAGRGAVRAVLRIVAVAALLPRRALAEAPPVATLSCPQGQSVRPYTALKTHAGPFAVASAAASACTADQLCVAVYEQPPGVFATLREGGGQAALPCGGFSWFFSTTADRRRSKAGACLTGGKVSYIATASGRCRACPLGTKTSFNGRACVADTLGEHLEAGARRRRARRKARAARERAALQA